MRLIENLAIKPVNIKDLPVILPTDVKFTGQGQSPLAQATDWVNTSCPNCGGPAKRDTDTMDTFVDSSWYYFRFLNPKFSEGIFDKSIADNWVPVDMYVGGAEHATMHLLYARFIHKFLRDLKLAKGDEPFLNLVHQGTITNAGAKMSKSKGNVVDPDDLIARFGADTVRLFSLFAAPPEKELEWSDQGVEGSHRFLHRVWKLVEEGIQSPEIGSAEVDRTLQRKIHQTIRKVTQDIDERMHQNTAISAIMELINATNDAIHGSNVPSARTVRKSVETILHLLNPFAPHMTEELWSNLGNQDLLSQLSWPEFDAELAQEDLAMIVVQVNGKLRASMPVPRGLAQQQILEMASDDEKVRKHLEGKEQMKIVFVPDKLINIVVR